MLRIAAKTKVSPQEATKLAVSYFGPEGLKMTINEQTPEYAFFVQGDGNVEVYADVEDNITTVEFVSREYEAQVKEFIGKVLPPLPVKQPLKMWVSLALIAIGIIAALVGWFGFDSVTGVVIGVIIALIGVALNNISVPRKS